MSGDFIYRNPIVVVRDYFIDRDIVVAVNDGFTEQDLKAVMI